ncbi:PDZ domain-containing protein [Amycolatopsis acidicola]|uniref:PDZ domain-containing protein n=1 Tax=Amycolatopsis acidicola TaxID=2596893 RepID=A0A5N0UMY7_9PSEU|nr:trypsin-like peptidase domain-containing protein [Amycolatopsis acidicola]KAA9151715.1 PDZ domain-containing protein [Amycolatopsis acidicola]
MSFVAWRTPALWFCLVAALVVGAAGCTGSPAPAQQAGTGTQSVAAVAAQALPAVVKILTSGGNGSGVVYGADGLILTNEHVVRGYQAVQVAFADGQRVNGTVRATDSVTDLALVQVSRTGLPVPKYQGDLPAVGDQLIVIGSPLGFENSVTAGVTSGLHREIPGSASESQALVDLIQTDAAISPGNSGGAVFNAEGEVVGISEAYIPPQSGAVSLGFAIPAATATDVADQLRDTGRARHAFAGLEPAQLTQQIVDQLHLSRADGVIAIAVTPAGPAANAGLRPGDILTAVDGVAINTPEDLLVQLRRRNPGDTVTVTFHRTDGQDQRATLTLTDRPAFSQ